MKEEIKLKVKKEGRKGIYIPEKEDLKEFIKARKFDVIHNFIAGGMMFIGADHDVESVMKDIDKAERIGILTKEAGSMNMGHALTLILKDERGQRHELYDIGEVEDKHLDIK